MESPHHLQRNPPDHREDPHLRLVIAGLQNGAVITRPSLNPNRGRNEVRCASEEPRPIQRDIHSLIDRVTRRAFRSKSVRALELEASERSGARRGVIPVRRKRLGVISLPKLPSRRSTAGR